MGIPARPTNGILQGSVMLPLDRMPTILNTIHGVTASERISLINTESEILCDCATFACCQSLKAIPELPETILAYLLQEHAHSVTQIFKAK
jgi:hypothetical protein